MGVHGGRPVISHAHHLHPSSELLVLTLLLTTHGHLFGEGLGSLHGRTTFVHSSEPSLAIDFLLAKPGAITRLPLRGADNAELVFAGWRALHVVTAFGALNGDTAFRALLPAIFFGGLDEFVDLGILGAVGAFRVVSAIAFRADLLLAFALSVDFVALLVCLNLFRLDPHTTARFWAIKAVFGTPFRIFSVPSYTPF